MLKRKTLKKDTSEQKHFEKKKSGKGSLKKDDLEQEQSEK